MTDTQRCEPRLRIKSITIDNGEVTDVEAVPADTPLDPPAALPSVVRALVEALEGWVSALDAKREFERENPNNSTKAWDDLFYAVEAAETEARAAIAAAKEAGV